MSKPKDEEGKKGAEPEAPVSVWDDPKQKRVKVRFLVDFLVGDKEFKCAEVREIPEVIAKGICDSRSVEYVK